MARRAAPAVDVSTDDLTIFGGDAIVNPTNTAMRNDGRGVNAAVYLKAGPDLAADCARIGSCPVGAVRVTPGHQLPARYVIHAVGPFWRGGWHKERAALAQTYRSVVAVARAYQMKSIAIPSISTGERRFPIGSAARIAVKTVMQELRRNPGSLQSVRFCCWSAEDAAHHRSALKRYK